MWRAIEKIFAALQRFCVRLYGLYMLIILCAIIFAAQGMTYAGKRTLTFDYWTYVLIAAVVGLLLVVIIALARRNTPPPSEDKSPLPFVLTVVFCVVVLICWQVIAVQGGWFRSGWDVGTLTDFGNEVDHTDYYSQYPNQVFLVSLFNFISWVGTQLGFTEGYLCLVFVGCACVDISMVLVAVAARKMVGNLCGSLVFVVSLALIGFSPWFMVPYSDTYGMLFVTLVFFTYVCCESKVLKWPIMVFVALLGYAIKPTVIFILVACVVIDGLQQFRVLAARRQAGDKIRFPGWKRIASGVAAIACMVLALYMPNMLITAMQNDDLVLDDEKAFSATHFLMMGFNPDTLGNYNGGDVAYSASFATKEERQQANIEIWLQRVQDAGPDGFAYRMLQKSLCVYNDGVFAWEGEGGFYMEPHGTDEMVKTIYGIEDEEGGHERPAYFAEPMQAIWMLVVIGLALLLITRFASKEACAMALALIFLSGFLMLFECRARYIFLYMPIIVTMGLYGWRGLYLRIQSLIGGFKTKRAMKNAAPKGVETVVFPSVAAPTDE